MNVFVSGIGLFYRCGSSIAVGAPQRKRRVKSRDKNVVRLADENEMWLDPLY